MVKVKICGVTRVEDAVMAVELGADALGFNFYPPSPRYVSPKGAAEILRELPKHVCKVAVFVSEPKARVGDVIAACRLDDGRALTGLQFHGDETGAYCRGWGLKVIKAFRIRSGESFSRMGAFPADYYLLDSWSPQFGGSGSGFSWDWIRGIAPERLILSGGLSLHNIEKAIHQVQPFAVDVCSGVESKPGVKDRDKLRDFILAAKAR